MVNFFAKFPLCFCFFQAFIIAFSSNLIPRLVYSMVVNPERTDAGFLNHSLAYFDTEYFASNTAPQSSSFGNVSICRYSEYRNPPDHPTLPYKRPTIYWHILAARLAFIVVFQVHEKIKFTKTLKITYNFFQLLLKKINLFAEYRRFGNHECSVVSEYNTS